MKILTIKWKLWAPAVVVLLICVAMLYILRPPGEPLHQNMAQSIFLPYAPFINAGTLPGVTWSDDIHPIFVKNKCGDCHSRGKEEIVEGLVDYSLGIIDPVNPHNPYFSYHELVYAEGPPQILDGETLRSGQCCWPCGFPADQQRRIWLGKPEQSAIVRKLDRNYYDWNTPPRFLEEGLQLSWGMPMPMFEIEEHADEENAHGHAAAPHDDEKGEHNENHDNDVRSPLSQILFNLKLWFGGARSELRNLPKMIPAKDRALLRYWIAHTIQLQQEGTGIEVKVSDNSGAALPEAKLNFVGNFNNAKMDKIKDVIKLNTDSSGYAILSFPKNSIVSTFWYVSLEDGNKKRRFKSLVIRPGKKVNIQLSANTQQ